ncbi:MAG: cephalosporin-C deacetylase, partial [Flavobacteriales bacterium]
MKIWFSFCLNLLSFCSFAQLSIVADNAQSSYQAGEVMNFLVTSTQSGMATYSIRHDRYTPPIATGTIQLTANQTAEIPFTLSEPGMVLCWVNQNNFKTTGGAVFSPFDIHPIEEDPMDLIAFWDNLKSELAAVDMNSVITFEQDHDYSTTYRINLASIDNRRVYGYISIPDGDGPFPAVLRVPPYGSVANIATPDFATAERTGMLAMSISIHNTEPDVVDPNSYEPDVIDNKDENYYRYAVIGAIRALDYLESRPDYDGQNMAVMGVSQGGGLSLMIAGLDDRVKVMANSNPALCNHTGYKYDKAGGFPYYLRKSDNEVGTQTHFDATVAATKYFDAARLAKYFEGPSLTLIGYRDTVCPPATSYAAFNNLPGPKVLVQAREVGHQHPNEYQIGRYDLFRRYFPSTLSPPWPWPDSTTGYFIEAAANSIIVNVNELLQLNGQVDLNGSADGNWTFNWRKIEGPGNATFSNSNSENPTVSFSTPGTYRLEFRANDEAIAIPDKFYTAIDYLTIDVSCNSVVTELAAVICEGEALTIGDETYTESGNYQQDLLTTFGCDSIVMIDLSV